MILVTVGTHLPFERLTRSAAAIATATDERVVVQVGGEQGEPSIERLGVVPFEELVALVRSARVVVTHAGVGSIITCLRNGKTPIVVPRRARFGEAADDHQVAFSRRLAEAGMVELVEDPADLGAAVASHRASSGLPTPSNRLVQELRAYLESSVRDR